MARENARTKGIRYATEGRLVVEEAGRQHFRATCRGSGAVHLVTYRRGTWDCTCPAKGPCAHLHASWLVAAPDCHRADAPVTVTAHKGEAR